MFVRPKDRTREIWTGKRFGVDGAKALFGAKEAHTIDRFPALLKDLFNKAENVYYKFGHNEEFDKQFSAVWSDSILPLHNSEIVSHNMRMIKSKEEIEIMRYAAKVSAEAHCLAMRVSHAGMREYQVQAEMERIFLYGAPVHQPTPQLLLVV